MLFLMDEPTSALDPISTLKVEELIAQLKKEYTIVIVTHNMQQAARVSDKTAFFLNGEIIEYDTTDNVFSSQRQKNRRLYYRSIRLNIEEYKNYPYGCIVLPG